MAEILDPEMLEHFPIGTRVRVTGVVREKFDQTILDTNGSATAVVARGTDAVPAPVTLDPVQAKAQAGTEDGRAYYERLEGMRVRIAEGTANSGGTNKFGELFLTLGPEQDRVFRTDTAQDLIAADSDAGAGNPAIPYRDEDGSSTTVHADLFDRVSDVVGPMSYDFSNYRVVVQPDVVPVVDRTPGPAYPYDALSPSAPDELRVASFNVENFFGAGAELDGGDVSEAEFVEKRDRIADAIDRLLERPDVVAVQEVDELAILQDVATELGGYTAYLREGNDNRGIDVGFLVKDTVTASNLRQWGKAQTEEVASTCADIPGRLFDRPPLSIDVERGGVELTVFSNHFASKSTPSNQDCRVAQAAFVAGAAAEVEAEGREVLVAGDLNDFEDEGAPTKLGETLNPLWGLAPAEQRYSFQFSGRLQTLDHMFVSDGLLDRVRDFTYAHFDNDYFERPDPDGRPPRLRPRSAGRDAAGRRSRAAAAGQPRRAHDRRPARLAGRAARGVARRGRVRVPLAALPDDRAVLVRADPRRHGAGLPGAARRPPALPALPGDRDGRRRHDGRVVGARVGERLVGRAQPATRTASPSAIRPGVVTRALIPNSVSCRFARWRSSCGHLACVPGSRVGIAQRSHGCSSSATTPPANSIRPPSQPCSAHGSLSRTTWTFGRKRRRSSSVPSSSPSATRVASTVISTVRPRSWMPARSRSSRTGRPRSAARSSARPSSSQPATRPSGAVSRANGGAAGSSVAPSSS